MCRAGSGEREDSRWLPRGGLQVLQLRWVEHWQLGPPYLWSWLGEAGILATGSWKLGGCRDAGVSRAQGPGWCCYCTLLRTEYVRRRCVVEIRVGRRAWGGLLYGTTVADGGRK